MSRPTRLTDLARLTRLGISVWGSRVLYVRGRSTGEPGYPVFRIER